MNALFDDREPKKLTTKEIAYLDPSPSFDDPLEGPEPNDVCTPVEQAHESARER